jgi:hypothetical protein
MATPTSTGKSAALMKPNNSASSLNATCPELELPVVSDFVSRVLPSYPADLIDEVLRDALYT